MSAPECVRFPAKRKRDAVLRRGASQNTTQAEKLLMNNERILASAHQT